MKVCFLLQDTRTVYGAERATLDLAQALADRGQAQVEFLLIHEARMGEGSSALQAAIRERGFATGLVTARAAFSPALVRAIRAQVLATGAQVVHVVGYKAHVHAGLALGWGRRCPMVAVVHGWLYRPNLKERFYGWVDLQCLKRASAVVALSRYYRELLSGKGVDARRLVCIPTGLAQDTLPDTGKALSQREDDAHVVFGVLGRFSEEKNHGLFLKAFARLRSGGVEARAVLAGDGPLRKEIEERIRSLGLGEVVGCPGYLARDAFFRQIDVLVSCSSIENLPYNVLEAMAWCRPVLATHVGGVPDLVEDGITGHLVAAGDERALAEAMQGVARAPARRQELGRAGRAKLEREFTMTICLARYLELYRSLISPSGKDG